MHRIALAVARGAEYGKSLVRDPTGENYPRTYLFDEAFDPAWDESLVSSGSGSKRLPQWWQLAKEVQRRHAEYDAVVSWGEKLSLAMMLQQQMTGHGTPHIAMMYQFEKPNIQIPLRLLKKNLHAVVTWSSVQRRALIERIGYPAERVYLIRHYVDQLFYSPRLVEQDMICSVGAEMRDYVTLKDAIQGTGVRCHIASNHVRVPGRFRILGDHHVPLDPIAEPAGGQITQSRLTLNELRELYARSRFVVIPLLPSDTDNGVTCILQAMAMGKAVVCSKTRGQVDVIQHGVTGLYVPVGDVRALREAIESLWNDPERAAQMGRDARAYIEKYHTLEMFTASVKSAAVAALESRGAPDTWWQ